MTEFQVGDPQVSQYQHISLSHIYIYKVLFGPVKLELGVIPSGQENYSRVNI